jgi:hypothetical protein
MELKRKRHGNKEHSSKRRMRKVNHISQTVPKAEDWDTVSLSTNPKFLSLIAESQKRLDTEGGISQDEMRRRLGVD